MPTAVILNHKYSKEVHYGQGLVFSNSKKKNKEEKGKAWRKLW